ncbi:hypothetical protein [Plantibacter sp. MPB07]|uniref:hypothetical protein n=1 Tax=Plantibacter sp. MPB07 TaxID=3388853 RepID=UPI0039869128
MTDPNPGRDLDGQDAPTNKPIEFDDDGQFRLDGYWNSYQFLPPLTGDDAHLLAARAEEVGYKLLFRRADYSVREVQALLVHSGPSYFLDLTELEEDISPKEPPATAEQRMAARMRKLAPETELVVTDPYLFTPGRKADATAYAKVVGRMIAPALTPGLRITAIVSPKGSHSTVRAAVEAELHSRGQDLTISVIEADDFHDRFWIADRERGFVSGTSLNKIGRRIFFVDELSPTDVIDVLAEVDRIVD